jgi:hypothetical protein
VELLSQTFQACGFEVPTDLCAVFKCPKVCGFDCPPRAGLAADWGCAAAVTDPIDDRARSLYRGFDFEPLREGSNRMIVATKTIISAIERSRMRA